MQTQPRPETKSRKQLSLMLIIMVATLGGSYLLFLLAKDTGVWATVNKGEFVKPTSSVTDFDWRTIEGASFSNEFPEAFAPQGGNVSRESRQSVKRTWWLVAIAGERCTEDCLDALEHMRALQILLTKDATRVRRAMVAAGVTDEAISARYPKLVQLSAAKSGALPTLPEAGIYIVDPTGVLVLRYPLVDSASDVQKDLKRLLKYSQLG